MTDVLDLAKRLIAAPSVTPATGVGGVAQPNLEERAVGIQLTVTPRVSPDGTIVMEVVATKDQISPNNVVPVFFDPQTGTTFDSPVIDTATAQASVSVRDGQTIVLGGMITRTEGTVERKVPWLADLPVLGAVFRYDSHTVRRTELLIFLTPRIMKTPADYEEQKQVEAERMSFSVEDAEEILPLDRPPYAHPSHTVCAVQGQYFLGILDPATPWTGGHLQFCYCIEYLGLRHQY